jgi:sugar lactone lactonase YvrE
LYIADSYNYRIRKVTSGGTITTVAGNGSCCFSGDGGPATSAELAYPQGVAVDASGNLYIADTDNSRIRKVTSGTITTVAGTGVYGYSGDNGPATSAELYYPYGVAVDAAGNLYIADTDNTRVRKVSAAGVITTLVGGGGLGDGGLGVFGSLNQPYGVARSNTGITYIADASHNRVRAVAASGAISTVAGTGVAGFSGDGGPAGSAQLNNPRGLALDASGNLYIADTSNARIRKVSTSGTITTVAGNGGWGYSGDNGPATSAELYYPQGVAVDASGSLYIADTNNFRIRKVTSGGTITTVAGTGVYGYSGDNGPATSAELYYPQGVAVDAAGNLYIADSYNYRIRKVTSGGTITTVAGKGGYG